MSIHMAVRQKQVLMEGHFDAKILAVAAAILALGTVAFFGLLRTPETARISGISHIHGIAVDRRDPSRLYLATHDAVYLTSRDGTAEQVSAERNDYVGFTAHPTEAAVFYASGHPPSGGNTGVIVSLNGARTWIKTADGANGRVDFHAISVSPVDPNVIYGLYRDIQVSRDGGKTWEVTGSAPPGTVDIAASAVDAHTLYAATRNGLMVSRSGGRGWNSAGPTGQPVTLVEIAPDGSIYTFVVRRGLLKGSPGAFVWEPIMQEFGNHVFLHLSIDPRAPNRMFAVTRQSKLLASTDGGKSWSDLKVVRGR
ncbi:hypothetical protein CDO22_34210 (plasmid) [Sinorhizobium meliloti]|nr:hypothetical protein CDO22_34210 [Sinorhizobium meliloti]